MGFFTSYWLPMSDATLENILQHFASKLSKKGFCTAIAHVNHVRLHSLQFGIRYTVYYTFFLFKVHIFWEGHKIFRNLQRRFDWHYIGQIYSGDFAKFCGLLRIYELYLTPGPLRIFMVCTTQRDLTKEILNKLDNR